VDLSSNWLAVGQNETTGLLHDYQVKQEETRTGVLVALKRGGFAGLGKRHECIGLGTDM
jgi:hypothetical protein